MSRWRVRGETQFEKESQTSRTRGRKKNGKAVLSFSRVKDDADDLEDLI